MFKKILPLAILPVVLMASPAEARRHFWWENPDVADYGPDPFYGQDPYASAEDQFNQEQFDLYQREMRRRYRDQTYYGDPYADPNFDYTYSKPAHHPKPKKKKVVAVQPVKKPVVATSVAPAPSAPKPARLDETASVNPVAPPPNKKPALAGVTCEKGSSIVSSFGFTNVTTKSCTGGTFTYGAERGGKPFEVEVSAANGELTAVKKL